MNSDKINAINLALQIYHINAFSDKEFGGNPAAVCPLKAFLSDNTMQAIAEQNNLSETAFIVPLNVHNYSIRWFSPKQEVELCGHATLAAAHVIFKYLQTDINKINFESIGGTLKAEQIENYIVLDFPARPSKKIDTPLLIKEAINYTPELVLGSDDYIVILKNQKQIMTLEVDQNKLLQLDRRGIVFTAPGNDADFVSRVFHPKLGIGEDPVCGSAHCELVPYWSRRLKKNSLNALQLSSRGGEIFCELNDNKVILKGRCKDYLHGEIYIAKP